MHDPHKFCRITFTAIDTVLFRRRMDFFSAFIFFNGLISPCQMIPTVRNGLVRNNLSPAHCLGCVVAPGPQSTRRQIVWQRKNSPIGFNWREHFAPLLHQIVADYPSGEMESSATNTAGAEMAEEKKKFCHGEPSLFWQQKLTQTSCVWEEWSGSCGISLLEMFNDENRGP